MTSTPIYTRPPHNVHLSCLLQVVMAQPASACRQNRQPGLPFAGVCGCVISAYRCSDSLQFGCSSSSATKYFLTFVCFSGQSLVILNTKRSLLPPQPYV